MELMPIWIKAILGPICGLYAKKKINWKEHEVAFTLVVSIVVFAFGVENIVYIADPIIETVSAKYTFQTNTNFAPFGRKYNFEDDYGNDYCLTMDFITYGKFIAR